MEKFRLAIATSGQEGLDDVVAETFGRAKTFTILEIEEGTAKSVKVINNPAISYEHGAGPIVVKMLVDTDIDIVIAPEFGPGALSLLRQHNIANVNVKHGTMVRNLVNKISARPSAEEL